MVCTVSMGSFLSLENTKNAALKAAITSLNLKVRRVVATVPPITIIMPGTLMKLWTSPPQKMAVAMRDTPEIIPISDPKSTVCT